MIQVVVNPQFSPFTVKESCVNPYYVKFHICKYTYFLTVFVTPKLVPPGILWICMQEAICRELQIIKLSTMYIPH